jgi:hydrogenase nickel incorporation protein HypB
LLPHVDFDVEQCLDYARRVNPDLQILQLSARTGDGLEAWLDWVRQGQQAALAQQVSRLEAKLAGVRARLATTAGR